MWGGSQKIGKCEKLRENCGKLRTSIPPPPASASERGKKSEVAQKWARRLKNLCCVGGPLRFRPGDKINVAQKWARWLHNPCRLGDPHRLGAGSTIVSGPQAGKVATQNLPPRGSPPLQTEGQNQKWPTSGQGGYITRAAYGVPSASQRGAQSEVAHKWARGLHNPCRLEGPLRFTAGGTIRSGPQVGKVATSPVPPMGSPPLHSGGHNQKWPTSGHGGYITPAA